MLYLYPCKTFTINNISIHTVGNVQTFASRLETNISSTLEGLAHFHKHTGISRAHSAATIPPFIFLRETGVILTSHDTPKTYMIETQLP